METTGIPASHAKLFGMTVRAMPYSLIKQIAEENKLVIPIDIVGNPEKITDYLLSELDDEAIQKLLNEYGYAGNVLIYYFASGEETPSVESLQKGGQSILSLSSGSPLLENVPYFEEVEANSLTGSFRARFHYFKGRIFFLDERTKTIKEKRRAYYGVVVYRPGKKLIEVRAKHKDIAFKSASRTASTVGFKRGIDTLDLRSQECIKKFLDWIRSLNNARLELSTRGALSSITMSSRGGTDLRNVKDFQKYLESGMLRGGHATIIEDREINFRIFFRDCRVYFTSFSNEDDIELVADALEKITGGFRFRTPERMIDEFFK